MVTLGLGALTRGAAAMAFAGIPAAIPIPIPSEPVVLHGAPIAAGKVVGAVVALACVAAVSRFIAMPFVRPYGMFGRPGVERL